VIDYLYELWWDRKAACYNTSSQKYPWYGARGITMYQPWIHDVQAFKDWIITNIGERPDGLTLDRIENDKGYEPGNLRWATMQEQALNRRVGIQPTNTGEPHISYVANPKKGKPFYVVKNANGYVGTKRALAEAITLRDEHEHSS
jgi:hypothetical protein